DNFDVVIRGIKLIPGDWDDKLGKIGDSIGSIQEPGEYFRQLWDEELSDALPDWRRWLPGPRS
ncbi:MAG: hypothetical protein ACE5Q6_17880, partial [Dehalococcoidia bacterium]